MDCIDGSIDKLNNGLSWDNLYAKHLKHSGEIFREFIGKLFSSFLRHNHVPKNMLSAEIRPVVKNGRASRTSSANYRPLMNSSMMLKVFEYCLLPVLKKSLSIDSRQFGFRSQTGCIDAVTVFREIISLYNSKKSNVYCSFIDLLKAFDKIIMICW